LLTGLFEIGFGLFILEPYPTLYKGTVPFCIGMSLFLSGCALLRQAVRFRHLPPLTNPVALSAPASSDALVIHVWTPSGTVDDTLVRNRLLNRYIAAVDINGVISAGHAALECGPEIYISHYPLDDIDRSAGDFVRLLRATPNNDRRAVSARLCGGGGRLVPVFGSGQFCSLRRPAVAGVLG